MTDNQPQFNCTSCGRPQYKSGTCVLCLRNQLALDSDYKPSIEQRTVIQFIAFLGKRLPEDIIIQVAPLAVEYIGGMEEFKRLERWAKDNG